MKALLRIADLHVHYGAIEAVKGIDLTLVQGRITTLLGANGAGKSSTLLTISGLVKASAGSIHFDGMEVHRLPPHRIVAHGIVQVPEGREILTTLTVKENLLLGAYRRRGHKAENAAEISSDQESVLELFPRLKERLDGAAGNLSGGEQQMLAIARALMARPRLLLLDEPSMGLAPRLVQEIFRTLRKLNQRGLTIFLVEQNVRQALKIADDAYILENGKTVLAGPSAEMLNNPRIIKAYLGG
jgi:branched-chain amino acid transport system ATP-binding protein